MGNKQPGGSGSEQGGGAGKISGDEEQARQVKLKDSPLAQPGSGGSGDDRQDNSAASPPVEGSESDPE